MIPRVNKNEEISPSNSNRAVNQAFGNFCALPIATIVYDLNGTIISWSLSAESIFGWTASEAIGQHFLQMLVPSQFHPELMQSIESLIQGSESLICSTYENYRSDGSTILCEWNSCAVQNADGSRQNIVTMARDVSVSLRQNLLETRLKEIIRAANESQVIDDVLLIILRGMLDLGEFDSVAVWTVDNGVLQGHWSVLHGAEIEDERQIFGAQQYWSEGAINVLSGEQPYVILHEPLLSSPFTGSAQWHSHLSSGQVIAIPLLARGETIGLILIDNRISIDILQLEIFQDFCKQISQTVATVRLLNEHVRIVKRQNGLMEIAAAISSTVELDDVLKLIRDAVSTESGYDRAGIWLIDGDTVRGTWGTDSVGSLRDERHISESLSNWGENIEDLVSGKSAFYIEDFDCPDSSYSDELRFIPHAVIALRIGGVLVGLISLDNLITSRQIDPHDLNALVPFAGQAAVAIRNAQVMQERKLLLERERRLIELSTAISASLDLNRVLRMVRDAAVDVGGFEKVGVWLLERGRLIGSWGTDAEGNPRDERTWNYRIEDGPHVQELIDSRLPFLIQSLPALTPANADQPSYIRQAIIALRAGDELVGILMVTNRRRDSRLTKEQISPLLPFAGQAAVAIRNARLVMDRERIRLRSEQLMQIASGMNASLTLEAILKMVHDALIGPDGFDRAAVFLYNSVTNTVTGTWGSNRKGETHDISDQIFELNSDDDWPMSRVIRSELDFALTENLMETFKLPPGHSLYGVRHHAVVPLKTAGEVVGAICVDNLPSSRPITRNEIDYLLPFAEQAALAIQNSQLFRSLKQAQDTLIGAEKMRALGELASGVAHNINNLLTAVLGYAEMIQMDANEPKRVVDYAKVIERAGHDGAEIVRRIQQFARKESSHMEAKFDLTQLTREAVDLARPVLVGRSSSKAEDIQLSTRLQEGAWVIGAATELREVILNLILNAVDAMPNGGQLTVTSEVDDENVRLSVCDTGIGMSDSVRRRIFDPFFTTKGPSMGTGLGLSLAWGVIGRHGGNIDVTSAPGKGSCFTIRLELAREGLSDEA